ncbi:hypothetical protein KP77_05480 [Jeotgalibacillus alimentarius]|uniref:Uncharacterized protein n=1 Tax=Jeotgalibacillus alimentarius TaxID=135826 RepID=A0A0C2WAI0_9BACL|nr:hypothetical protein [Jeotgalibacillus alimentarius]KIL53571.1 hypothetical protein KP77_05480 [Jeotgalibacillus alimentarius]
MDPKKLIYATFYIIGPLLYFTAYTTIQYFNGAPIGETMSDALSIIALYLIGVSILWLFTMDKLEQAIEADRKAKQADQN